MPAHHCDICDEPLERPSRENAVYSTFSMVYLCDQCLETLPEPESDTDRAAREHRKLWPVISFYADNE